MYYTRNEIHYFSNANKLSRSALTLYTGAPDAGYYNRVVEPAPGVPENLYKPPYLYANYMDSTPVLGVDQSDLKQNYLSREQLNSRKIAPAITQEQLLFYENSIKQNK